MVSNLHVKLVTFAKLETVIITAMKIANIIQLVASALYFVEERQF